MHRWGYGAAAVFAGALFLVASGTQRERPVVTRDAASLQALEAAASSGAEATRALAQAYVDARQPGLAVVRIEAAAPELRGDARVRHVYARALIDEGRNDDALAVSRSLVAMCAPAHGQPPGPGCDALILASAVRRTAILDALVSRGVEDTQAQPELSLVAYENATREARIAAVAAE